MAYVSEFSDDLTLLAAGLEWQLIEWEDAKIIIILDPSLPVGTFRSTLAGSSTVLSLLTGRGCFSFC